MDQGGPQADRARMQQFGTEADLGAPEDREIIVPIDFEAQEQAYIRQIRCSICLAMSHFQ